MAHITSTTLGEALTERFACPLGCTVETEFDLGRLRNRLYVWGKDYPNVGCRIALSIDEAVVKGRDDSALDELLKMAREIDLDMHRLEGAL